MLATGAPAALRPAVKMLVNWKVAGRTGRLQDVEALEAEVGADFHAVTAAEPGEVVDELSDGSGEVGVAVSWGPSCCKPTMS